MAGSGPLRVAVVGCGNIAQSYTSSMATQKEKITMVGAFDLDRSRADAVTKEYGGKTYDTLDAVLADPGVEAIVNLTIHQAHVPVITQCLEARKHVLTEKPISLDPKDAQKLVSLAKRKRVRLSSAPITPLGEAQQTAWKLIRDGKLGPVRVVYAERNWGRIERWHPNPKPFYDVGAMYDVGVYPLMLVTAILGPAVRASGFGKVVYPKRSNSSGEPFTIKTPDWLCGVVEFKSGAVLRITSSFYVGPTKQTGIEFHGDKGSIYTSEHAFDSAVEYREFGEKEWVNQPLVRPGFNGIEWARGVVELHDAIREDRPQRCSGAQAAHVVEIIAGIHKSSKTGGKPVTLKSRFLAPEPMDWAR